MSDNNLEAQAEGKVAGGISRDAKRNVCMTKVSSWLSAAAVIERDFDRLEEHEKEAYKYIRHIFENNSFEEQTVIEQQTMLRDAGNAFTDNFGVALGKFASATGSILKNYAMFKDCLEEVQTKAASETVVRTIGEAKPEAKPRPSRSGIHQDTRIINGAKWEGTFNGDTPYGSGKIYLKKGAVYEGEWNAEGSNGKGVLIMEDGDRWIATFVNGDPVSGVIEYKNGSKYEGGLNENGPHGRGRTTYADRVDEGEYCDGERVGTGRMDWNNGDWYVGGWDDEGFNGEGTFFMKKYGRTDHGTYSSGKRVGRGRMEWPSGTWYEGEWGETGGNGKGKLHFSSGNECTGDFVDGKRQGEGVMTFTNGDTYSGTWSEDEEGNLYGEGVYTWVDGSKQRGKYVKNKWVAERTAPVRTTTPKTNQEKQGHFTPISTTEKNETPRIVTPESKTSTFKSGVSYFFVVVRNIIAWSMSLGAFATTFACMQGNDFSIWGMIGVGLIILLSQWIYAGNGERKDSWFSPFALFGIVLLINAVIYLCTGIFGSGGLSLIFAAVFWGFVGLMAIGKAFDD